MANDFVMKVRASEMVIENPEALEELSGLDRAVRMCGEGKMDEETLDRIFSNFFLFPLRGDGFLCQERMYQWVVENLRTSIRYENGEVSVCVHFLELLRRIVFDARFVSSELDIRRYDCRDSLIKLFAIPIEEQYRDQSLRMFAIITRMLGEFEPKWAPVILEVAGQGDFDLMPLFCAIIEADVSVHQGFAEFMLKCVDDVLHMRKQKWKQWEALRYVDAMIEKGHQIDYAKILDTLPDIVKTKDIKVLKLALSILLHLGTANVDFVRFSMQCILEIPDFGGDEWHICLMAQFVLYVGSQEIRSQISGLVPELGTFFMKFVEHPLYTIRSQALTGVLTIYRGEPPFSVELLVAILDHMDMPSMDKRGISVILRWIDTVSNDNFQTIVDHLTERKEQLYDLITMNSEWPESIILEKYLDALFKHTD